MGHRFETLGNASVMVFDGERPVLATDPWLTGTCYFGSWALDHPLTEEQIGRFQAADYIWISHGHPDHLHDESLALLPRGKKILVPDHYNAEIASHLKDLGFDVTVLPYRKWFRISDTVRVLCMDNMNQDAILVIEAGDALVINMNDSPLCGELGFLRRLVRKHPRDKTYLLALCSVDADMFNFVDENGRSLVGPPEERKRGAIWGVARTAERVGVGSFCCSSSQHIYVRGDSIWANPYRIGWADMQSHWSRPKVRLVEPFVTVDLATGSYVRNHPLQQSDAAQITGQTGEDDWAARLSDAEWGQVEAFVRRFEMARRHVDFVEFTVGGETRRFDINRPDTRPEAKRRGVAFIVPKQSLMTTVEYGYLDDLLIGNFMKVRLVNTTLYPRFTPLVAKIGGNAKVYTRAQYRAFLWRYLLRNPLGTIDYRLGIEMNYVIVPFIRSLAESLGIKRPLKYLYRSMLGDPLKRQDVVD
ncbi:MAG TPA: hypothetical protein VLJ20_03845 [Acetobacteraceae bacterium]|nr:hypothetical protein [Acetobacteraceae bacterium]